jgi:hypothetical protein
LIDLSWHKKILSSLIVRLRDAVTSFFWLETIDKTTFSEIKINCIKLFEKDSISSDSIFFVNSSTISFAFRFKIRIFVFISLSLWINWSQNWVLNMSNNSTRFNSRIEQKFLFHESGRILAIVQRSNSTREIVPNLKLNKIR